jgi:hypothetical protein
LGESRSETTQQARCRQEKLKEGRQQDPRLAQQQEEAQVYQIPDERRDKDPQGYKSGYWFLTTKTVPPESFSEMTFDERSLMTKFREKEAHAVKSVQTGVAKDVAATVVVVNDELGAQLGPKLKLVTNQPSPIFTALNQIGTGNSLVLTTPTVQFGHAAHPAQDEEKVDG